ncbi:MAG: M4 family metallopeptidase [Pseudomonadota bacterium]
MSPSLQEEQSSEATAPRLHCICCALPRSVLRHVAAHAADGHARRLSQHDRVSARLRAARGTREEAPSPMRTLFAAQPESAPARRGAAKSAERAVYDAGGAEELPGRLVRTEGARAVSDPVVNAAYANVGLTLQFYAKVFGRHSLDDQGMAITSSVHYGDRFSNAMWTGRQMLFGDGDGIHIMGFAQSLDIVAHELTHAVTQSAVPGGLGQQRRGDKVRLAGQAGALNESFSDVFASMVKQWHAKQDVREADWLIGAGVLAPELGRAVRSLKDPGNPARTYAADDQARDMAGYVPNGDVHANSGIPNHAFYLAARALGGHSWERAGRIWYEALHKLGSRAGFTDAAAATTATATALFGDGSAERKAVVAAWRKVKVSA